MQPAFGIVIEKIDGGRMQQNVLYGCIMSGEIKPSRHSLFLRPIGGERHV